MSDRGRYDSAMFWLAFGTARAVIGGYYAERSKLFEQWDRQHKDRPRKRKS